MVCQRYCKRSCIIEMQNQVNKVPAVGQWNSLDIDSVFNCFKTLGRGFLLWREENKEGNGRISVMMKFIVGMKNNRIRTAAFNLQHRFLLGVADR